MSRFTGTVYSKYKRPLMKAMYKGYIEATDEVIDRRLEQWFTSAHRSNLRAKRQELKSMKA